MRSFHCHGIVCRDVNIACKATDPIVKCTSSCLNETHFFPAQATMKPVICRDCDRGKESKSSLDILRCFLFFPYLYLYTYIRLLFCSSFTLSVTLMYFFVFKCPALHSMFAVHTGIDKFRRMFTVDHTFPALEAFNYLFRSYVG